MKERISISLDKETTKKIKSFLKKHNFRNQSHLIETAIKELIKKEEGAKKRKNEYNE